jgi:LuxR family maltose regulon positive regulatory protein
MDATGDEAGAVDAMRAAIETANQVSASYAASMAARQVRLWLAHENTTRALAWAEASDLHSDDAIDFDDVPKYESLARVYIAQGQDDPDRLNQAAHLLENLRAVVERAGAAYFTVRILVLQAAALASSRADRAQTALARAVDLAAPQGYIRVFLDETDTIGHQLLSVLSRRQLAQQPASKDTPPAYGDTLQSALQVALSRPSRQVAGHQPSAWVEPLSEREREVLQLVAEGLSNREIAQTLVIAVNTVKNHLKNIYGKLAVHTRTQAVNRARTLDLL